MKPIRNITKSVYKHLVKHYSENQPFSRHDILPICKRLHASPRAAGRILINLEARQIINPTGGTIPNGHQTRPSKIYTFDPTQAFRTQCESLILSEAEKRFNQAADALNNVLDCMTKRRLGGH